MFAAMDNLQQPPVPPTASNTAPGTHPSIDPRKQELLEARFMGSSQRIQLGGYNSSPTQPPPHYPHQNIHYSITAHHHPPPPPPPPHPHLPHPSAQTINQHQLQSTTSSSTSSNPSSSSPSIPQTNSPFSSTLSQQQQPLPQQQQPQQQNLSTISSSSTAAPLSFTAVNNNNLNNPANPANNNSAGSTQSSCHYSAHSSSHNQDSNLSTASGGSHCSDKQEAPLYCDNHHAHNLNNTPEKRSHSQVDHNIQTTPTGANGANSTGSQRKRRKKDPNESVSERNTSSSKRGENKKVTEYFKVNKCHLLLIFKFIMFCFLLLFQNNHSSPSRYNAAGAKSPTSNSHPFYMYQQQQQQVVSSVASSASPSTLASGLLSTTASSTASDLNILHHHTMTNSFMTPQSRGTSSTNHLQHLNSIATPNSYTSKIQQSISTQTDLTMSKLSNQDEHYASELESRDSKIDEMSRSMEELRRQLKAYREDSEKQSDRLNKCIDVTKQLLVEKSLMEKKAARQKCMQNRLRLGQFVTQRQGNFPLPFTSPYLNFIVYQIINYLHFRCCICRKLG